MLESLSSEQLIEEMQLISVTPHCQAVAGSCRGKYFSGSRDRVAGRRLRDSATRLSVCGVTEIHQTIYAFWKSGFLSSITQVKLEDQKDINNIKLPSDDFFLQDKVVGLFYKNIIIGIFFLKWVDLNAAGILDLRYFNDYPKEIVEYFFRENQTKLIIMSYMYVAPDWRRHEKPILIADILPGIAIKYLLETNYDAIIGITRDDYRKANLIYFRYGWYPLHSLTLFGRPASIVILPKDKIQFYSQEIMQQVGYLWGSLEEILSPRTCCGV